MTEVINVERTVRDFLAAKMRKKRKQKPRRSCVFCAFLRQERSGFYVTLASSVANEVNPHSELRIPHFAHHHLHSDITKVMTKTRTRFMYAKK